MNKKEINMKKVIVAMLISALAFTTQADPIPVLETVTNLGSTAHPDTNLRLSDAGQGWFTDSGGAWGVNSGVITGSGNTTVNGRRPVVQVFDVSSFVGTELTVNFNYTTATANELYFYAFAYDSTPGLNTNLGNLIGDDGRYKSVNTGTGISNALNDDGTIARETTDGILLEGPTDTFSRTFTISEDIRFLSIAFARNNRSVSTNSTISNLSLDISEVSATPEPSSYALLVLGLCGLVYARRKKTNY